jgi:opacity protein-like surface antigen
MKTLSMCAAALVAAASILSAQYVSPPAQTSVTIGGKTLSIKYSAPSVHGRKIFGPGGKISEDGTYPVWRAGANDATAFHTDADLDIGGLAVPKGDYTIFVLVSDPEHWKLIINKQTHQWGLSYSQSQDLGRVDMTMSKPPSKIETYKMTLSQAGPNAGKLQLEWDNYVATVPIKVK